MPAAGLPPLTEKLLRFGLELRWEDVPPEVIDKAKIFLFDTLTVGFAGSATPEAGAIRRAASLWGAGDEAPVVGVRERLPATQAAFVNAFHFHCLEWDSVHEQAVVHAMSVPTAALLAQASRDPGASGREFLLALIVAVDLAVNLGIAATSAIRFFRPGTAGLMGASLGLARLAGAHALEGAADIMGLAYSQVSGTMQAHVEGSIALPIQIAVAARAAISALDLAQSGLSGPHNVLEGPFGYASLIEATSELERIPPRLGRRFGIAELSHKPFPTGRAAHAVLDGLRGLIARERLTADDIERVDAYVPPLIERLVARRPAAGMAASYARLCLPFLAASQTLQGPLGPRSYDRDRLDCPSTLALAERIHILPDGTADPNALSPQRLVVAARDGRRFELDIPDTLGAPLNPLTSEQRAAKALACLEPVFGEACGDRARRLQDAIDELPNGDCRALLALLSP